MNVHSEPPERASGNAVGFIGTGAMGRGMARSLARSGYAVKASDSDAAALSGLANTPSIDTGGVDEAGACRIVITMLPSETATRGIARILAAVMPENGVHIMMGTIGPELIHELQSLHTGARQRFVAAPVFGRPDEAMEGDLTISAGGPADAEIMSVLRAMGPRVHVFDHPLQACVVKLAGNGLIGAAIAALAESLALVEANGIDAAAFHQIVTAKLFQGPVYRGVGSLMVKDEVDPPNKFTAALAHKDIALLRQCHAIAGTRAPVAFEVFSQLERAIDAGYASADWSVLARLAATAKNPKRA